MSQINTNIFRILFNFVPEKNYLQLILTSLIALLHQTSSTFVPIWKLLAVVWKIYKSFDWSFDSKCIRWARIRKSYMLYTDISEGLYKI